MDGMKTPFDNPDSFGPNESASGEASSATGIFGAVSIPATRVEEDLFAPPVQKAPAPFAEAPVPVPPPAAAAPTPAASAGEFTRMLQALKTETQAAPASSDRKSTR